MSETEDHIEPIESIWGPRGYVGGLLLLETVIHEVDPATEESLPPIPVVADETMPRDVLELRGADGSVAKIIDLEPRGKGFIFWGAPERVRGCNACGLLTADYDACMHCGAPRKTDIAAITRDIARGT